MSLINRRDILATVFGLVGNCVLIGQAVELTFRVDMQHETIDASGVHVAGSFQNAAGLGANWNPGGTPMDDSDGDGIYERTVTLPPGNYLYKFVNGNSWQDKPEMPQPDCSLNDGGGNYNRQVTVHSADINLPVVQFDSCNAYIHFQVNMKDVEVSDQGVHVIGDFQRAAGFKEDWAPGTIEMYDWNGDNAYEITLQVPPGTYHYLFVNGSSNADAESPDAGCTVDHENRQVRQVIVGTNQANSPDVYCYDTCDPCDPAVSTDYTTEWWNDAVFYEIFVRSFYDSDGDGIGDLRGIIEKLDYLNDGDPETTSDLGITGIWLMPIFSSPTYHGYDAIDYYTIEPDYGTMEDFEDLLDAAHDRGIRVILDFIMNHVSVQHPWFTQSAIDQGGFRDWFIWEDNNPGFTGPWGQDVWHHRHGDYYYGLFWSGMPDLNYSHPPVKDEMFEVTRFWLDKGVDGFRLDAIKYLDEDGTILEDTPETFALLQEFRTHYKSINPDAVTVGEVWSPTNSVVPYVRENRLDLCFEFDLAFAIVNSVNVGEPSAISGQLDVIQSSYQKLQYSTFLTNHDIDRVFSTFLAVGSKMRQAAALYLTLPGVPFIYYGEEIGMIGTGAHENIRTPMQWSDGVSAGFTTGSPWQQVGANYHTNNVADLDADDGSLLNYYRSLVQLRNAFAPMRRGYLLKLMTGDDKILAYSRIYENEAAIVVSNFNSTAKSVVISQVVSSLQPGEYDVTNALNGANHGTVSISQDGGFVNWEPSTALLGPRETLILTLKPVGSTSLDEVKAYQPSVVLTPNPVEDLLDARWEPESVGESVIQILDPEARVLKEIRTSDSQLTIDVSDIPSGLYYIRVIQGARQHIAGFIKAR